MKAIMSAGCEARQFLAGVVAGVIAGVVAGVVAEVYDGHTC